MNSSPPTPIIDDLGVIECRTEGLARMWARASEDDRSMLGAMHVHYESEVARMVGDASNASYNVAHTLHGVADESIAAVMTTAHGPNVQCKAGCAACCHLHVNITRAEADLLVVSMAETGTTVDWHEVQRQAQFDFAHWHKQSEQQRRCVFLRDNRCSVYEHRPMSCRKYLVMSNPKHCDTVRHPGHRVSILAAPEAEVVASAMLGVLSAGSLPRMLLEAKEAYDGQEKERQNS